MQQKANSQQTEAIKYFPTVLSWDTQLTLLKGEERKTTAEQVAVLCIKCRCQAKKRITEISSRHGAVLAATIRGREKCATSLSDK